MLSETYPPDVNGVAFTLEKLANGLAELGHKVQIVRPRPVNAMDAHEAPAGPPQYVVKSLPVPGYPSLRMGWPSLLALRRLWKKERPDVVYIATEGPLGWSAMLLARRMGIPAGSGYHTNFCDYLPSYGGARLVKLAGAMQRWFHNNCAFTLAPSRDTVARLRSSGYERVELMRRGVDSVRFTPSKCNQALRQAWGANPGDFIVLLVGRVAAEKNLPFALNAAAKLRDAHPRMKVVVVGDGPKLEEYREQFPFAHFAGEHRGESLAEHYASGDLLLFPSMTETFGNVLLEAMASGLPTLSYDYAAAREHVVDGENGWVVPYGNEAAYLQMFTSLLQASPFLLDAVGSAARRSALGLTWSTIVDRFAMLLRGTQKQESEQPVSHPLPLISSTTNQHS